MASEQAVTIDPLCWDFLEYPERFIDSSYRVHGRMLEPETTRRQFATASEILRRMTGAAGVAPPKRGVLLADDVGLGKTMIGILVACCIAASGLGHNVRILAPNETMARAWAKELQMVIDALRACDITPNFARLRAKRDVARLPPFSIQVVSHHYAATDRRLAADLLIVDEAHRAKGEGSRFSQRLQMNGGQASRVLILTATPFSIEIEELNRMLALVGGETARDAVVAYKSALAALYTGNTARSAAGAADQLVDAARNAVAAIRPWVIRHSVADLPLERVAIGTTEDWLIPVATASASDLELLLRMDRASTLARRADRSLAKLANDPRYHVGWRHFDAEYRRLSNEIPTIGSESAQSIAHHLHAIDVSRSAGHAHPKVLAVSTALETVINSGEKALVFCHHIATAQELTAHLARKYTRPLDTAMPSQSVFREVWQGTLPPQRTDARSSMGSEVRRIFIEWLSSPGISAQVWAWVTEGQSSTVDLASSLTRVRPRHPKARGSIASEADALLSEILGEASTTRVFQEAASVNRTDRIPGTSLSRAMGIIDPGAVDADDPFLVHNRNPDTIMAIFNSPFGPDILVATDRMSEGINLHRYCRHLVHYELDASPIRTVQRNGRVRRVASWAAQIGEPIRYAYPAFAGTRDAQLVKNMRRRVASFSLLLGGVPDISLESGASGDEIWREEVIGLARSELAKIGASLRLDPTTSA